MGEEEKSSYSHKEISAPLKNPLTPLYYRLLQSKEQKIATSKSFWEQKNFSPTIAQIKKSSTFAVAFELRERQTRTAEVVLQLLTKTVEARFEFWCGSSVG